MDYYKKPPTTTTERFAVAAAICCAIWGLLGFLHWLGLLFRPREATFVFNKLTNRWFTTPTVLVIASPFVVYGGKTLSNPDTTVDALKGLASSLFGVVIVILHIAGWKLKQAS